MAGTILLVEDEPSVGELVRGYLTRDGYRVVWVRSGEDALVELDRHQIRMVLLDIGLPGKDGFEICREIRGRSQVPILMLTARDEEPDRIVGLEVGADDYLTKPFSPRELVARMKAIFRRTEPQDRRELVLARRRRARQGVARRHGRRQARRADREGVRPARVLHVEQRRRRLARRAARPRVGAGVSRAARAPSTSTSPSCAASWAAPT